MNYPFGQHFVFAMPNCPWGEFLPQGAPGTPLAHDAILPGMSVPKDGVLVPSDAPGFGIDIDTGLDRTTGGLIRRRPLIREEQRMKRSG